MPGSIKSIKLFFILLFFGALCARGQQAPASYSLKSVIASLNTFRDKLPIEKLYLQTDKPYYNSGDTIRFKAYLLNADFLTPSVRSGMLYVELDNVSGRMAKRIMVPVASGVSWGDIALDEMEIPQGSYTLRAYTNWMRNFDEDYIFKKNIYISATSGTSTLVKADFRLSDKGDKINIQAALHFTGMDKQTLGLRDMQLRVMNGRRTLFRDKATTNIDGTMDVNFDLADKTALNNLSIQAQYRGKGTDTTILTIPVTINRPENTDLQFMPEGGNLVAGIPTKVGFKAIGEDGKGTDISGKIYNSKQQEVAVFKAAHAGMGSFDLTPIAGESYTAVIDLPGKQTKSYPLPVSKSSGTVLNVISKTDSLEIVLNVTADAIGNTYYLIGQSRGVVCYAVHPDLSSGKMIIKVAKSLFPTGIARFTLLTNTNVPLNERIVYVDHDDNLNIGITSDRKSYTLRDSIALSVMVKDKDGKPVEGTFSMAVTDNDQVRTDSLGNNISNNLLFTSDLKGTIEEPGYYFAENTPQRTAELDNLLLTQGWVGYDWKDVFKPQTAPKFLAEKEFIIQGKVTNLFNKPVEKSQVVLFGKAPTVFRDTVTDKGGIFTFKGLFPIDTAEFKLEARNKKGREFNVGIEMLHEFIPPVFIQNQHVSPWYVNSDTTLLNNNSTKAAQLKAEADYKGEGHMLKTVEIKSMRIIPDSHNLNGPGEADEIVTEKEIKEIKPKKTLFELLTEKFKKSFYRAAITRHSRGANYRSSIQYELYGHRVYLVIDGIRTNDDMLYILTAEDIKGIEIMRTSRYAPAYDPDFMSKLIILHEIDVPIFLEITTYSGHGPYYKTTPGTYTYRALPYTLPKEFYRPRYTVKNMNAAVGLDMRSSIHWEPNLITDTTGKATVSFFSADKSADYNIIIEGTDLNGNIGYRRQEIKVKKQ